MTDEVNKDIVRRLLEEGFNAGNPDAFDRYLADDFVHHDPVNPDIIDREGLKHYWAGICSAFPDRQVVADELIAEGSRVVKRATFRGTQTGPLPGLPPTGKAVTMSGVGVYRIEDGRVKELWFLVDTFGMLQQLGAIPQPEAVPA
ncbi:MAG: ester cyclase [Chloroflexota bacterium]